ncbi:uncharacterized protein NPIL_18941 [Nephila pilipes]|uniref:Uncharacterized protein n=1 Tax=Nephila pilipes TaxID=299642 RepID=A0A8X6U2Q2_NEPPI|nr:uncharacterized protein NPIL_18941 [Nephila pilipes]
MDMYALYSGTSAPRMPTTPLKSVTTLTVDKVLDPDKWLNCIQWACYQQQGQKASMEWLIALPHLSGSYYSLGEEGSLLLPRENNMEMIQIHPETVRAIAGLSTEFCKKPTLRQVDLQKC